MRRLSRFLLIPAILLGVGMTPSLAQAIGPKHRHHHGPCRGSTPDGCPPYWSDPYADLSPWPYNLPMMNGPRNWAWKYPHGGFTAYPGLPGSGVLPYSDYSHVNWVIPPYVHAQQVNEKLDRIGVPMVPIEPIFLGKNPRAADKVRLPTPKSWIKDEDKDMPKEMNKEK